MNITKSYVQCEVLDTANTGDCSNKSYVAIKKCRMLRSGVQLYAHDEVPVELIKLLPKERQNERIYRVYRKPEAVVKHIADFNYIAFVNKHPTVDVTPENYKNLSIGNVGGTAKLVTLDDGNVYVENEIVFTDKQAYEDYKDGRKEVSIGMDCLWRLADSDEYDFEVFDFENVNHLALVDKARAGREARILDTGAVVDRAIGGKPMKGFLGLFGIKKPVSDSGDTPLSAALLAGLAKIKKEMKDEEVEAIVLSVMDNINPLGDTEQKKVLAGIVADAFADPEAVLNAEETARQSLADSVDSLYAKCKAIDEAAAQAIINDACGKSEAEKPAEDEKPADKEDEKPAEKPAEDEKPAEEKPAEDACSKDKCKDEAIPTGAIEAAVKKALDSALDEKIEAAVKKALNLEPGAAKPEAKGAATDSAPALNIDDAALVIDAWGGR